MCQTLPIFLAQITYSIHSLTLEISPSLTTLTIPTNEWLTPTMPPTNMHPVKLMPPNNDIYIFYILYTIYPMVNRNAVIFFIPKFRSPFHKSCTTTTTDLEARVKRQKFCTYSLFSSCEDFVLNWMTWN